MVKCSSMMVKWYVYTLISPSLPSIWPSLTSILPSLALSKPSLPHLTIIEKLHRLYIRVSMLCQMSNIHPIIKSPKIMHKNKKYIIQIYIIFIFSSFTRTHILFRMFWFIQEALFFTWVHHSYAGTYSCSRKLQKTHWRNSQGLKLPHTIDIYFSKISSFTSIKI